MEEKYAAHLLKMMVDLVEKTDDTEGDDIEPVISGLTKAYVSLTKGGGSDMLHGDAAEKFMNAAYQKLAKTDSLEAFSPPDWALGAADGVHKDVLLAEVKKQVRDNKNFYRYAQSLRGAAEALSAAKKALR